MTFLLGVLVGIVLAVGFVVLVGRGILGAVAVRPAPSAPGGAIASEKQQVRESAVAILRSEDGAHVRVVPSREESA